MLGTGFITIIFGGLLPLMPLMLWDLFTLGNSPYPVIGSFVIACIVDAVGVYLFWVFAAKAMPLECYHMPLWFMQILIMQMPMLKPLLSRDALKARAKMRAAELHKQFLSEVAGDLRLHPLVA